MTTRLLAATLPLVLGLALAAQAGEPSAVLEDFGPAAPTHTTVTTPRAPTGAQSREASSARDRGVTWMKRHQHSDGGWSSGAHGTDGSEAQSDVATTAFTVLALLRDAHGADTHRDAIKRGTLFVVDRVKTAPEGPRLNTPDGTQIQYKLGRLVDTHMAALMLGEVAGTLDTATNQKVDDALDRVIAKVQLAQNADGSFDSNGWAPVLSSSIAAQSLNRAVDLGKNVDKSVLTRSDDYQAEMVSEEGDFDASAGAGVELYAVASSMRTNSQAAKRAGGAGARRALEVQQAATGKVSADASGELMAGFGSIGGEEMLSYMMISDTLSEEGGSEWKQWNDRIGTYLAGIQNGDGSWVGHHCITSRAFTTAGAIMTLASGDWADHVSKRPRSSG